MERAASPRLKATQLEIWLSLKDIPARHAICIRLCFVLGIAALEPALLSVPDDLLQERFGIPHQNAVGIDLRLIWNKGHMVASKQCFYTSSMILGSDFISTLRCVGFDRNGCKIGRSIKIDRFHPLVEIRKLYIALRYARQQSD